MTVRIRSAILEDVPAMARLTVTIHELHVAAQPDRYKPMQADNPALLNKHQQQVESDSATVLVAIDGDELVGCLIALPQAIEENPFIHTGMNFHIDHMGVLPGKRGQGIGGMLMDRALAIGRELDADNVSLGVAAFNEGAVRFYERYGFSVRSHKMNRKLTP